MNGVKAATAVPERIPVHFADGTTGAILPEGTRVRSKHHPELTGVIKHWEWTRSVDRGDPESVLSPIPYCIGWDDSAAACDALGFLFVYASDYGVEPIHDDAAPVSGVKAPTDLRVLLDEFEHPEEGSWGAAATANERLLVALRNAAPYLLDVVEAARSVFVEDGLALYSLGDALDALDRHLEGEK